MNGIQEVSGSIPLSSTKKIKGLGQYDLALFLFCAFLFPLLFHPRGSCRPFPTRSHIPTESIQAVT